MQFCLAAYTDKGKTRKVNQDAFLVQQAELGGERCVLAAVCDGMGGLQKGELASSEMIRSLADWFRDRLPRLLDAPDWEQQMLLSLEERIRRENEKLERYGAEHGLRLGTTLTAVLFRRDQYYAVHVGDSRLYEITEKTRQLTRDHSLAAEAVEQGLLTRAEGELDRRRSVLTRCIGACGEVTPEYRRGPIQKGAVYLLCTDGFWHGNGIEKLSAVFRPEQGGTEKRLRKAAKKLAMQNRKKGETDNLTALLIQPLAESAARKKKRGKSCWKQGSS